MVKADREGEEEEKKSLLEKKEEERSRADDSFIKSTNYLINTHSNR